MQFTANPKYEQALVSTLIHIQTHLHEELPLEELAGRVGFSPFHFHRVFTEYVGEPVKEYIRRLRLENSAYRLKISLPLFLAHLTKLASAYFGSFVALRTQTG